jgi:hypothetical protein
MIIPPRFSSRYKVRNIYRKPIDKFYQYRIINSGIIIPE